MPQALAFFDGDGETPLSSYFFGLVTPGSSYFERNEEYKQIVVKNVGDVDFSGVFVEIVPFGSNDGSSRVRIATGETPGAWKAMSDGPLDLGPLEADASANLWVDIVEPTTTLLAQNKGWTFQVAGIPAESGS